MTIKYKKTFKQNNLGEAVYNWQKSLVGKLIKYSVANTEMVTSQKELLRTRDMSRHFKKMTQVTSEQMRGSSASLIQSSAS